MSGAPREREQSRRLTFADHLPMRFEDRYSRLDRILHRMAFATIEVQTAIADIEDRIYAERLAGIEIDRPVFITSLPRSGTTLLLETLNSLDVFAAHTYRDMPFLLMPLLWDAISRRLRTSGAIVERAHGDGMTISRDSAEAFEEVLWRVFWPDKYRKDRIMTWTAADQDANGQFEPFIKMHMRKLMALRASSQPRHIRYLSKNNANTSRIPKILQLFSDAVILIPFRNPADHAGSMLRQHLNFEKIHAEEAFTRRYMEDIGHFEFGANLRPIDFGRWLDREGPELAHTADFWLKYWCAAFEHLLAHPADHIVFVSYDLLCANPTQALRCIGERIGLDDLAGLVPAGDRFRAPTGYDADVLDIDCHLLDRALALHDELLTRSIGRPGAAGCSVPVPCNRER